MMMQRCCSICMRFSFVLIKKRICDGLLEYSLVGVVMLGLKNERQEEGTIESFEVPVH